MIHISRQVFSRFVTIATDFPAKSNEQLDYIWESLPKITTHIQYTPLTPSQSFNGLNFIVFVGTSSH